MKHIRFLKNQNGSGLAEVLIAVAILAVVAIGVSNYVVNQKQFNAKIEGSSVCRGDVESLLKDFTNGSNTLVANSLTGSDGATKKVLPTTPRLAYSTVVSGTSQYANFQNIENSVTRAFLLYKSAGDNSFCATTDGKTAAATFFSDSATYNRIIADGKTVKIRITPVKLSSNVEYCNTTTNQLITPLSSTNPNNDYGFKVKITVTTAASGQVCSGETTIKYNSDTTTPTITQTVPITGNATSCTFSGTIRSNEPGSVFECQLDGGAWGLCSGTTLTTPAANTPTEATINYTGMAAPGSHTLKIRTVDSAGNRTTAGGEVTSPVVNCVPPVSCPAGTVVVPASPTTEAPFHAGANPYANTKCYVGSCNGTNGASVTIRNPTTLGGRVIASLSCCPSGTTGATSGTFNGYCTTGCNPSNDTVTAYYPYGPTHIGNDVYGTDTTSCAAACTMICANYVNCFYRPNCVTGNPAVDNPWMGSCGLGASFSLGCGATATSAICDDGNPIHECAYLSVDSGNNPAAAFPTDTRSSCPLNCPPGQYQSGASCINCAAGTYSPGGSGVTCSACSGPPANASWIARTTGNTTAANCEFDCNSGYAWDGSSCQATACGTCGDPTLNACGSSYSSTCSISGAPCTGVGTQGCGGGGGGCFLAGTPVLMADGSYKAIDEIQAGEQVFAMNEYSGQVLASAVITPLHHEAKLQTLFTFFLEDGTVFTSNDIHPIFVVSENSYVDAKYIFMMFNANKEISFKRIDGEAIRVLDMQTTQKVVPVYNLSIEGWPDYKKTYIRYQEAGHNYYVKGFLVHNLGAMK